MGTISSLLAPFFTRPWAFILQNYTIVGTGKSGFRHSLFFPRNPPRVVMYLFVKTMVEIAAC